MDSHKNIYSRAVGTGRMNAMDMENTYINMRNAEISFN